MAQKKPSLELLLSSSAGKKILFLGREGIFTQPELERFMKKYDISYTSNYEANVVALVEHTMLNPVEEDISNTAYEDGLPFFKLAEFEKILTSSINDDELLMGIKLANDQQRIFRLLGNAHISNELFVKLLSMYEWDDEEEDSREDRDVIMYTLRRYINIKPNEEDLLYSYLTLRRLATEATDPNLLLSLIGFPNFEFLVRGKEKVTLRETIARNSHIDSEVISKLISLRDRQVDVALAANRSVGVHILEGFVKKNELSINEALATNRQINDFIFEALLNEEQSVVELLLLWQSIDVKRLKQIENKAFDTDLFSIMGANEKLDSDVVDLLLQKDNVELFVHLASNTLLKPEVLEKIYQKKIKDTCINLAKNPSISVKILEEMYQDHHKESDIIQALASNTSTPVAILKELFQRDDLEVNKGLASNASLPMEMLDILKVDTRLQNYLAENPVFIKEYEAVFEYDGNAIR